MFHSKNKFNSISFIMNTTDKMIIEISAHINLPPEKTWQLFNLPEHITKWNHADDSWHSPSAENDLREGGKFNFRMEAKDGSEGFNFEGTYSRIKPFELIEYILGDNRKVIITFTDKGDGTEVKEIFEAENVFSLELQKQGWQSILNNFKKYAESTKK